MNADIIASSIIVEGLRPYLKDKTNPEKQREKRIFPLFPDFVLATMMISLHQR